MAENTSGQKTASQMLCTGEEHPVWKTVYHSPVKLILIVGISLFVYEALIMAVIRYLPPLPEWVLIVLDPALLLILLSPTLFFFFLKPLLMNLSVLRKEEEEIHTLNEACERKVIERTAQFELANKKLEEINALNQAIFQAIPFGMDIVDTDYNILFLSPKLEAVFGEEAIGKKCWEVYRDSKAPCTECPLNKGIEPCESVTIETEGFFGGKVFQISHTAMMYQGKKAVLEIFEDITARKLLEVEQIKLSAVIRQAADLVMITDTNGIIEYVNNAFEELTGYKRDEIIGKTPDVLSSGVQRKEFYNNLWITIKRGEVFRGILVNRKKNGEFYYSEKTITPIKGPQGNIISFVSTDKDITERKRYEEELIAANRELVKLERLKSEFITTVSHELRTPIGIMREGVSQVLEGLHGEISEGQRQYLGKSLSHMERLTKIVNSILEIANLEAGKIGPRMEEVDIAVIAREMIRMFEPSAQNKNVEIRAHFSSRGEPLCSPEKIVLRGDRNKLGQVFTSVIDNAVKFTEKGHIEVQIQETADTVECVVSDTGRGMTKEASANVFDKFQQFGREYGPGQKGVGLGLAITKGIIELHKGKIWIESELGKGTRVSFSLPKG
ncbi:MAG: hypothetical protein A2Y00_02160 [Omnitrophica WOR_2 bacterium GWF2_43_52]|nr:MAG: hypothetical protein A2Y01_04910 [Omnitrophica WOR_2 bacterium GWC2_44_8]OGX22150.1 MAG: hypothetical protein A2Y00_02160 [Omnitrophica WOR_2 bacterium GWF2_43_52]HAH20623.1 hypothetical protein [Candidatus Omnitrophota bacterium]HBG63541.1 hypothetical protein [Candidatus Omnitrophota bacterium]